MAKTPEQRQRERAARQREHESYLEFLGAMETGLDKASGAGRTVEERRMLAGELCAVATECDDAIDALSLGLRAVRLDPGCLDARVLLALAAGGPQDELIEELQEIVSVGEQRLGAAYFQENRGEFWGLLETRPYMRARARLADELRAAGRMEETVAHYEGMLELNPNDNLGLRYLLLGCYLEQGSLVGARRLFKEYDEDGAIFDWGRVLERYLAGDLPGAAHALGRARKSNLHVEPFLTGKKKPPRRMPDLYQHGAISEAVVCWRELGPAWKRNRDALAWLKGEHGSGYLEPQAKDGIK